MYLLFNLEGNITNMLMSQILENVVNVFNFKETDTFFEKVVNFEGDN